MNNNENKQKMKKKQITIENRFLFHFQPIAF